MWIVNVVWSKLWRTACGQTDTQTHRQTQGQTKYAKTWQIHRHFIIICISAAWQGEGKISKNVTNTQTDRHTLHHYIYIIIMVIMVIMVIRVIRIIRITSVKSSMGIITCQGHISQANANSQWVSQSVTHITSRASCDAKYVNSSMTSSMANIMCRLSETLRAARILLKQLPRISWRTWPPIVRFKEREEKGIFHQDSDADAVAQEPKTAKHWGKDS